jgi:hypothetical protein
MQPIPLSAQRPADVQPITAIYPRPHRFGPGNDPEDGPPQHKPFNRLTGPQGDLPYKVELWDEAQKSVEQVLAVTAHSSIGYAAYYAATREYPDRYITLRHRDRIVSRSNASEQEH